MRGIIFEYDHPRSVRNRQFTVRLSERERIGHRWEKKGPNKIYLNSDLPEINRKIVDYHLFQKILKSEMEFRKLEVRFPSGDDELSLFRVSPHDLQEFIVESQKLKILCDHNGTILNFDYVSNVKPEIIFQHTDQGYLMGTFLKGIKVSTLDYIVSSRQVIAVYKDKIFALPPEIPQNFFASLPAGRIPFQALESTQKSLSQYGDKINLRVQGKKKKKTIIEADCKPVLNFEPSLKYARLSFQYPDNFMVKSNDPRKVFFDLAKGTEIQRNRDLEKRYKNILEESGVKHRPSDRDEWIFPSSKLDTIIRKLGKKGFRFRVENKPLRIKAKNNWQVRIEDNLIHVQGSITYKQHRGDLTSILKAFINKQRFFRLSDGSYCYMSRSFKNELGSLFKNGLIKKNEIVIQDFHFTDISEMFQAKDNVEVDEGFNELLVFEKEMGQLKAYPVPESLVNILRPYQKHGFYWLSSLKELGFGGILADDMGLGKTLQTLTLLLSLKNGGETGPSLLVVPKTLLYNWEIEINKFTPSLTYLIHTGADRDKEPGRFIKHDLVITSYALVRLDFELFEKVEWNYLILDEAQNIKNPRAQVTRAVKALKTEHRLSLSGTPVENSPLDLWSHFDFLMPGFLGRMKDFKDKYNLAEPEGLKELNSKSGPFILRRLKSQVCRELPPKTEITLFCEFNEDQRLFYEQAISAGKDEISEKRLKEKSMSIHILTLLLRLRQISCHPALVLADKKGSKHTSGKHDLVLSTAQEILAEGHKILIFSQFTEHLKLLRDTFNSEELASFYLDGSTVNRQEVIEGFQGYGHPCVFFMSLKAGGLGLNLTEASYVFLLDPWWNPAVENQAIDRCYRIGQDNPVTVYRFITKDSIEQKVSQLQEIKKVMEKTVISEAEIDHVPLTEERLEQLLDSI